jgi:TolB-like protein
MEFSKSEPTIGRTRVKTLLVFSLLFAFFSITMLQASLTGNNSLLLNTSARVAGMGEAFTAVCDDGAAIEYNPAGLSRIDDFFISCMHSNLGPEIMFEYLNCIKQTEAGALGLSFSAVHLTPMEDATFSYFDLIMSLAYAHHLFGPFDGGITAKIQSSKIGESPALGAAFDLGLLASFYLPSYSSKTRPSFFLGYDLKNLGTGLKYADEIEAFPVIHRMGIGYKLTETLTLAFDLVKNESQPWQYSAGIENITGQILNLRLGYLGGSYTSIGGGVGVLFKLGKFLATADISYTFRNYMDQALWVMLSFQKTPPEKEKYGVVFRDRVVVKEKVVEKEKLVEKLTVSTQLSVMTQQQTVQPVTNIEIIKNTNINAFSIQTQKPAELPLVQTITQRKIMTQRMGPAKSSMNIAVLDFDNTGNSQDWEFLSKTIADSVSASMGEQLGVSVISRTKFNEVMSVLGIKPGGPLPVGDLHRICTALKINVIVKGSFVEISNDLQITSEVYEVSSGKVLASSLTSGKVGSNMFDLMDRTSSSIIKDLKPIIKQ